MFVRVGKRLVLHGFPYGYPLTSLDNDLKKAFNTVEKAKGNSVKGCVHVAVVHGYVWRKGCGFEGADEQKHQKKYIRRLAGYNCAIFGDNHRGFLTHREDIDLFNCGNFMRLSMDEIDSKPKVGLIHKDGHVSTVKLDCSQDQFISKERVNAVVQNSLDLGRAIAKIAGMGVSIFDFAERLMRYMEETNTDKLVRDMVNDAIFKHKNKDKIERRLD